MSKKDYRLIAGVIRKQLDTTESLNERLRVKSVAHDLSTAFQANNAWFNAERFLLACGFTRRELEGR